MRSTNAIMHPEYQWSPRKNDIGIIITPSPITLDQYVSVVSLSPLHTIIPLEYEQIRISGFGSRSNIAGEISENLQTTYQIVTSLISVPANIKWGIQISFVLKALRIGARKTVEVVPHSSKGEQEY